MWRLIIIFFLSSFLFILWLGIKKNFLLSATGLTCQFHYFLFSVEFSQLNISRDGCYQQSTTTLRRENVRQL